VKRPAIIEREEIQKWEVVWNYLCVLRNMTKVKGIGLSWNIYVRAIVWMLRELRDKDEER